MTNILTLIWIRTSEDINLNYIRDIRKIEYF